MSLPALREATTAFRSQPVTRRNAERSSTSAPQNVQTTGFTQTPRKRFSRVRANRKPGKWYDANF
jgi:hypothetical protein